MTNDPNKKERPAPPPLGNERLGQRPEPQPQRLERPARRREQFDDQSEDHFDDQFENHSEEPVQQVLPGLEQYVSAPEELEPEPEPPPRRKRAAVARAPEDSDNSDRADRAQRSQKAERIEKSERLDSSNRTERPAKAAKPKKTYADDDDDEDEDDDRPVEKYQPPSFTVEGAKTFFIDYWHTAKSVCLAPVPFFEAMPRKGGYARPATFLAVGACGHSFIHFLWNPSPLAFLADVAFTMCLFLLLSGGIVALLKHFERQSDMEEVFRVLAYGSPILIVMGLAWLEIPGLIYMAVLWFLGLKTLYDK